MEAAARSRWQDCLNAYARRHKNWLARLERKGAPSTPLAPLQWIDTDGSQLVIELGPERHHLALPDRIIELTDDDGDRGLALDYGDRMLMLSFRVSQRPEMIGN
jgi:hypothetical protein